VRSWHIGPSPAVGLTVAISGSHLSFVQIENRRARSAPTTPDRLRAKQPDVSRAVYGTNRLSIWARPCPYFFEAPARQHRRSSNMHGGIAEQVASPSAAIAEALVQDANKRSLRPLSVRS